MAGRLTLGSLAPAAIAAAALSLACMGQIAGTDTGPSESGGAGPGARGSGNTAVAGPGAGGIVPAASACSSTKRQPGPSLLRRLLNTEYDNTVRDLLNDASAPGKAFPVEGKGGAVFANEAASTTIAAALAVEGYMTAAEQLAANAVKNLSALLGCNPAPAGTAEDTCIRGFIERFGKRAFRRPLAAQEVTDLFNLYKTIRTKRDVSRSVEVTLRAILQSPNFLYRWEIGTSGSAGTAVALTSYEMASRLSYTFWGSMPDDTLFAAADAGALKTNDQIVAQARRLWASPRSGPMIEQFYREWLDLDLLPTAEKEPADFKLLKGAMERETLAFVSHVLRGPAGAKFADGKLETLLTAPMSFLNADLASSKLYGVPGVTGSNFRAVDLDGTQRAGVLTQPGVLSVHGDSELDAPIYRGKMIRLKFLCQTLPDPPGNVPPLPPRDPNASIRQQLAQHSSVEACSGCHKLLDPVGFGFEGYDSIGKWRTKIGPFDVNNEGELVGTKDIDGKFRGAPELAKKLASSNEARECMTLNSFRYVFGRATGSDDACSLGQAHKIFAAWGFDLRELMMGLVQTDAFQYRSTGGAQ